MKRPVLPASIPMVHVRFGFAALAVAAIILVLNSGSPGERGRPVAAQSATPAAGFPECSAWELRLIPLENTDVAGNTGLLGDVYWVLELRLYELTFYQYEYVLDGSLSDEHDVPTDTTQVVVQLLIRSEADTPERLFFYEGVFTNRGDVLIMDMQTLRATPVGATPMTGSRAIATPLVARSTPSLLLGNEAIWNAYPEDERSGEQVVTIELAEEAKPTLQSYLGDESSRELAIVLDGVVIAIVNLDSTQAAEGRISIPATDEDLADAWVVALRSGELPIDLASEGWEPVYSDPCA